MSDIEAFAASDLSVISILMFLAATLAVYAVYWILVFNRREQKIVNRRLQLSKSLRDPTALLETLQRERGFHNLRSPVLREMNDWLMQTGIRLELTPSILVSVALFLVLFLGASYFEGAGLKSFAFAVVATIAILLLYLYRARRKRISTFGDQLPEAIDVIVRGVRVGLPFSTAITLVAREMPDPIGSEFGMLADEIAFGHSVRPALENLYRRVGQRDLLFLTVAVSIQTQTGGNLGEILSRLSRLMRNRAGMYLKIRALSAEGRTTAFALSGFPFMMYLFLTWISPTYYDTLRAAHLLQPAIYIGLVLLMIGNSIMFRMANFKY